MRSEDAVNVRTKVMRTPQPQVSGDAQGVSRKGSLDEAKSQGRKSKRHRGMNAEVLSEGDSVKETGAQARYDISATSKTQS